MSNRHPKLVGVLGLAGSGKDTIAQILGRHANYVTVSFADRLKRVCMEVFDFTPEQVWGSIELKEKPDERYPRAHTWDQMTLNSSKPELTQCQCCFAYYNRHPQPNCYLTPRYAMRLLGTEWGRHCYQDVWAKDTLRVAQKIYEEGGYFYSRVRGLQKLEDSRNEVYKLNVVIPDVRFVSETRRVHEAGGIVIRVVRPGIETVGGHSSETEQLTIPDDKLQGVIMNDGTLEDLKRKVLRLINGPEAWTSH